MTGVILGRLESRNFKNLRLETSLNFSHLNILIGPNGSGKSNLIGLLQFLQQCLMDANGEAGRGRTSFEDAIFRLGGSRILDATFSAPANVGINYQFMRGSTKTIFQSRTHSTSIKETRARNREQEMSVLSRNSRMSLSAEFGRGEAWKLVAQSPTFSRMPTSVVFR